MTDQRVVLATNNQQKLIELRRLLALGGHEIEVVGLGDVPAYPEPAETEWSFEANALLKARACVQHTGETALADDSGLEVDALNNCPGVRSARWAGPQADDEANTDLVLRQLGDVPPTQRGAHFVCAMALVTADGQEHIVRAEWPGSLAEEPRGGNGFGYDPIFIPEGFGITSAELSPSDKDALSHRGQAVRAMVPVLAEVLSSSETAQ